MTLEGLLNEVDNVATFAAKSSGASSSSDSARLDTLAKSLSNIESQLASLISIVTKLTGSCPVAAGKAPAACPAKAAAPAPKAAPAKPAAKDDDDMDDLFASDEEADAEAERVRAERLAAYAEKKSKKGPGPVAKSSIVLDVKPWDDETNLDDMQAQVRAIEMDGLVWGAAKYVEIAFGIKKLQIMCVVEDEKVSVDELVEKIQEFEDFVQSVDIAAFNKV